MFVSALIEEVDLVGGGDSDGWIDGYVRDCDPDDALVVIAQVLDLSF